MRQLLRVPYMGRYLTAQAFSILGDTSPLAPEFLTLAREHRIILSRSSERSLRAMAQVTAYGKHLAVARANEAAKPFAGMPKLGSGAQAEWLGKQVLAAAGIAVPQGALARSVDDATFQKAKGEYLAMAHSGLGLIDYQHFQDLQSSFKRLGSPGLGSVKQHQPLLNN